LNGSTTTGLDATTQNSNYDVATGLATGKLLNGSAYVGNTGNLLENNVTKHFYQPKLSRKLNGMQMTNLLIKQEVILMQLHGKQFLN